MGACCVVVVAASAAGGCWCSSAAEVAEVGLGIDAAAPGTAPEEAAPLEVPVVVAGTALLCCEFSAVPVADPAAAAVPVAVVVDAAVGAAVDAVEVGCVAEG